MIRSGPLVLVAFDSFKGSLGASEACRAAGEGIRSARPDAVIRVCPLADGGEGTADVLAEAWGGRWVRAETTHPARASKRTAEWLSVGGPGRPDAVVEMARASGLTLLHPHERDPLRTTTAGTGDLIAAARQAGARRIWLTLGGSGTVDGGTGAARALGWSFLDRTGSPLPPGGGALVDLRRIVPPSTRFDGSVVALYDVDNPLLGPHGAARIFGPQKGASSDDVERLEAGLERLSEQIASDLGVDVGAVSGGGAAGGLGAGAMAFLGASLEPGAERVFDAIGFDARLDGVDWVVTGEGAVDATSFGGKVVGEVVSRARVGGARVAVVAGRLDLDARELTDRGVAWAGALERLEGAGEVMRARAAEFALRLSSDAQPPRSSA